MELKKLIEHTPIVSIAGDDTMEITGLSYDSRSIKPGDLFFAVSGEAHDGHDYIGDAVKRGARAIVVGRDVAVSGATRVLVPDVRLAMGGQGAIADTFFNNPTGRLNLFGVTGTNGKTTVCYIVEKIAESSKKSVGVVGTINYRFAGEVKAASHTTPQSLDLLSLLDDMAKRGVTHVAMEVSSHALDQRRVEFCDFNAAAFTNLTQDHLDYHKTMDDYFQSKARLFRELVGRRKNTLSVLNIDDPRIALIVPEVRGEVMTFGLSREADIYVPSYSVDKKGIRGKILTPYGKCGFASNLLGLHNIYNILAAMGGAFGMGFSLEEVERGINRPITIPGRLEIVPGEKNILVLVDYAHTDDALKNVLSTLVPLTEERLFTVFGCGGDRDKKKRPLMARAAAEKSHVVVVTSDNPRTEDPDVIISDILKGFHGLNIEEARHEDIKQDNSKRLFIVIPDRGEAIRYAVMQAKKGDIVLIAGKGHEDYQIIGREKIPFDDRIEASDALATKKGER